MVIKKMFQNVMSLLAYSLLVHTMRKTVSAAQVHVAVVCTNQPHTPYLCKPHYNHAAEGSYGTNANIVMYYFFLINLTHR